MTLGKRIILFIIIVSAISLSIYWFTLPKKEAQIRLNWPSVSRVNTTFEVPIIINTTKTANAAELHFGFPADLVEIKEVKKENSIFELWIANSPSFSNEQGRISLEGGSPNPGFAGDNLLVATLIVEARRSGRGKIVLLPQSRILANDGLGSLIESRFREILFRIE